MPSRVALVAWLRSHLSADCTSPSRDCFEAFMLGRSLLRFCRLFGSSTGYQGRKIPLAIESAHVVLAGNRASPFVSGGSSRHSESHPPQDGPSGQIETSPCPRY